MLPVRKDDLLPDSRRDLAYVSDVISSVLSHSGSNWKEVVCEFEDDRNYLSISAATMPGNDEPTVQVELGVQDARFRRAAGGLVARWSQVDRRINGLEIVIVDGKPCDVSAFAHRLSAYVDLPATVEDTVMHSAD